MYGHKALQHKLLKYYYYLLEGILVQHKKTNSNLEVC